MSQYTIPFDQIGMADVAKVGGKNASLGEMFQNLSQQGVNVPDGFATTADAYWLFIDHNNIRQQLTDILAELDTDQYTNLPEVGQKIRDTIKRGTIPQEVQRAIEDAYKKLQERNKAARQVAVRSSATAEDLPTASFAGQLETYLNIEGKEALMDACLRCFASLFTNRAIQYRVYQGFDHMQVALSVGVQQMVRADQGCSGVAFTIEPDSGFDKVISLTGAWGLGENVVQGAVTPDEFLLYKPALQNTYEPVISRKLGEKEKMMVYADKQNHEPGVRTVNMDTPEDKRDQLILSDEELIKLGHWLLTIEEHYNHPMDVEWAKDGITGELYIVQARPETVHTSKQEPYIIHSYKLKGQPNELAHGIGLGGRIASGKARILASPAESDKLQEGEVLVTDITNPDWDPIMKKAAAIVTNKGGRTSHAAIVAREVGAVAVVGAGNATEVIEDGQQVTVSCAEGSTGFIYDGRLDWETEDIDVREMQLPNTEVMLILGDPDKAFKYAYYPCNGIGLMRLEFIINNAIQIHPMALVNYGDLPNGENKERISYLTRHYEDKEHYFVDQLAQSVATIAAAFYPKDVIVRMSDFKTNEYANLIGGQAFEPKEANPMIGFRGASRYYSPLYKEGFRLECEAMKVVRNKMGLTNAKLMIPFCRTVEEGKEVIEMMNEYGLKQGDNGLEIYVMVEIPSNVMLADQFAEVFDGFSIGSNDLTQLTLGLDRDSELISYLFNEKHPAIKDMIARAIQSARQSDKKIGLCGQAPSDFPDFATFLVEQGINSISFNPDALIKGITNIKLAEAQKEHVDSS